MFTKRSISRIKSCLCLTICALLTATITQSSNSQLLTLEKANKELLKVAKAGILERVKELITVHKADVNTVDKSGYTPLHLTCLMGHKEIVNFLIKAGANVNAKRGTSGSTPLHYACGKVFPEIVSALLAAKANVSEKNEINSTTPLFYACCSSTRPRAPETIKLLIKKAPIPS